jgi:GYF domain 2
MTDDWYYVGPAGRVGPITLQDLRTSLASLPQPGAVVVWRENSVTWQCAGDVSELKPVSAKIGIPQQSLGKTVKAATKGERHTAVAALIVGLIVILLGCGLFYLGIW